MPQPIRHYPVDGFVAESKRISTRDNQGGWHSPDQHLMLKCTLPAFVPDKDQKYTIDSALVLYAAGVHDDLLTALIPQATIKGLGAPRQPAQHPDRSLLAHGVDFITEQTPVGGPIREIMKGLWNLRKNVCMSLSHTLDLTLSGQKLGVINIKTIVLPHSRYLRTNGFPVELDLPDQENEVMYSHIEAHFTREQIAYILHHSKRKLPEYIEPRLVVRLRMPESKFSNTGGRPKAAFHTVFNSSEHPKNHNYLTQENIPLKPVRYIRGRAKEQIALDAVQAEIQRHSQRHKENEEVRTAHIVARLNAIYSRHQHAACELFRSQNVGENPMRIAEYFTHTFVEFCMMNGVNIAQVVGPAAITNFKPTNELPQFMVEQGDALLEDMLTELDTTFVLCNNNSCDYIVWICDKGQMDGHSDAEAVLGVRTIEHANDPEMLCTIAAARVNSLRGTMDGRLKARHRREADKKKKQAEDSD